MTRPGDEPTPTPMEKIGRRRALKVMGVGTVSVGVAAIAGACGGEEASQSGPGCNDPIDAASQQLRTSLQYKDVSDQPGKRCDNCAQYVEGAHGQCGGCNLFTGPVQPGGYCISWAPKS